MKILLPIVPKDIYIPGKGNVSANLLEVRVSSYRLKQGATAFYDLQTRTVTPASGDTPEIVADVSLGLSGNVDLTAAQFNAWAADDNWFATCVASNLGLTPA